MKDVWAACEFRGDVISADFSKAKFAVELHEFVDGTADRTYLEPRTFFENTFLTDQMELLVRDTLARLGTGGGQPVTVIDTGFGGGKTHSLLLLHHILGNRGMGLDFVREHGIAPDAGGVPQARIAVIDCRRITKNTLWGEIAHQLGRYAEFEEMDRQRKPPMDISALKRLFGGPVLVMLDELPHYLFKADGIRVGKKTLGELTITFVMELISAAASSSRGCLIFTLTESQNLYEGYSANVRSGVNRRMSDFRADELAGNLIEAVSRQAHVMTPVNRDQIYDVVKARLVKHIDENERAAAIREYAAYYERYGMDAGGMLEKMERSYPFHPSLIDTLHGRVSTIDKFNQTRGMLRLLARVVRQVVDEKPDCKMIGTPEVRFDNAEIKDELTVRLGLNLGTIIDVDCIGHARESDGAKSVRVVEPMASTIMLFSLHGHTKRKSGIKRGDIKLAIGRPGLDPSLIDRGLDEDVMNSFWYVHDIGGMEFYFDEFPNTVAIIDDYKKSVNQAETGEEIRKTLKGLLPSDALKTVFWDRNELKDDRSLKLLVAEYDTDLSGETGDAYVADILSTSGNGIRTNQNTVAVLYAEPEYARTLEYAARTLVAIRKAKRDERIRADRQFIRQIAGRESDASAQLKSDCLSAYSHVMYPRGTGIRRSEMRFGESKKTTITDMVIEHLENQGKLVRRVGPDGLEVGDAPANIEKLYNSFAEDKSKPFVLDMESIGEAIREGMRTGKFGYCAEIKKVGDRYAAEMNASDFDWSGFVVDGKMVQVMTPPPPRSAGFAAVAGRNPGRANSGMLYSMTTSVTFADSSEKLPFSIWTTGGSRQEKSSERSLSRVTPTLP